LWADRALCVRPYHLSKLVAGDILPSQAEGRGFESRFPLHIGHTLGEAGHFARPSSLPSHRRSLEPAEHAHKGWEADVDDQQRDEGRQQNVVQAEGAVLRQ
jgi:hypothetical protein